MPKPRGVDAKLHRLQALRKEPAANGHLAELRLALADKSNLVAAVAAEITGERGLTELAPELLAAFDRFMIEPAQSDKLCRAKIAIAEALNRIDCEDEAVFLKAVRHVQMEPRWGGSDDAAAPLRGAGAFGLVRLNHQGVALLLADLLVDPEKVARAAAAQALGASGSAAAVALLRFKARVGDEEPEVTAACLTGLMTAVPAESLPVVAEFLDAPSEAVREGAVFALAESRRPDAFDVLTAHWPGARHGPLQDTLLLAISTMRLPAALDFLLGVLADDDRDAAGGALSALAIHRHNDAVRDRIAAAVAKNGDAGLREQFKRLVAANA